MSNDRATPYIAAPLRCRTTAASMPSLGECSGAGSKGNEFLTAMDASENGTTAVRSSTSCDHGSANLFRLRRGEGLLSRTVALTTGWRFPPLGHAVNVVNIVRLQTSDHKAPSACAT